MTVMTRKWTVLFPGQGSQRVGMINDLLQRWPQIVTPILEEASEAIQSNLQKLMSIGPQENLTQTPIAQPAILAHSYALLSILQQEVNFQISSKTCNFVAGHSLGEYTALLATNVINFSTAAHLVHQRGLAMDRATNSKSGAMAAIMPIDGKSAEKLCEEAVKYTNAVCSVANLNSNKQIVISGDKTAVQYAIDLGKEQKKVRRAIMLDVSAPFHSPLMENAALDLKEFLADVVFNLPPTVPIVWNVEGEASSKTEDELKELLVDQVVKPVKWSQTIDFCINHSNSDFLELGSGGGVLTGLVKQNSPSAAARHVGTAESIQSFVDELTKAK